MGAAIMEREVKILKDLPLNDLISAPLNAVINAQAAAALTTVNFIERVGLLNKTDKKRGIFDKSKAGGDDYDVRIARLNMEKQTFVPAVVPAPEIGDAAHPTGMRAAPGTADPPGLDATAEANDGAHPAGFPKHVAKVDAADAKIINTSEKIELPFLSLLPIPSFEVTELNWDFNVKLNSVEEFSTDFTHSDETTADVGSSFALNLGEFLSVGSHMKVQSTVKNDFELRYGSSHEAEYNLKISIKATAAKTPLGIERLLGIAEKIATNNETATARLAAPGK
jgi:hypothetical protein